MREFPVVDTAASEHFPSDDGNSASYNNNNSDSAATAIAQRSIKSGKAIGKNRGSNRRTSHSLVPTPTHSRYSDDDNSYGSTTFDTSNSKDILSDPETESEYLFASGLYGLKRVSQPLSCFAFWSAHYAKEVINIITSYNSDWQTTRIIYVR
eukprot:2813-Heterococcus_DN1.PRE.1